MITANLSPSRREQPHRARRSAGAVLAVAVGAAATLAGLVTIASPAGADPPTPIRVTTNNFAGTGSLSEAIDAANADPDASVIHIEVEGLINVTSELSITAPVAIAHSTGTSDDLTLDAGGNNRFLRLLSAGTVSLEGVSLSGGTSATGNGGSISSSSTDLTLTDVLIASSTAPAATGNGGGIYSSGGGDLTLDRVHVLSSSAGRSGGGLYVGGGTLTVTDSLFDHDTAGSSADEEGGGGIYAGAGASATIRTSAFGSNTATNGDGGGLGGTGASVQITGVTFDTNTAGRFGGGIALVGGSLVLESSYLTANSAAATGGAIRTDDVDATVGGSVLNDNHAVGQGGGIEVATTHGQGSIDIEASSILRNGQGGSQVHGVSIPSVRMADTIVADNLSGDDFAVTATAFDVHHSLIEAPSSGSTAALTGHGNLLGVDPALSIADGLPSPSPTSPVVDAGDPAFDPATYGLTTDLRGEARVSGVAVDMGVVELKHGVLADAPDLEAGSDAGASSTDEITNHSTLTFDVNGSAGQAVELFEDGDPTGVRRTGDGPLATWTATAGTHDYHLVVTDEVGTSTAALEVTVDLTAPAAPGVPDLAAASDLGTSSTDNLTSATTRTFDLTGVETDATVTLRQIYQMFVPPLFCPPLCGGFQDFPADVGSRTGNGTVTESHAPGGPAPITYKAIQTDLAGNTSGQSGALGVTFDFSPPSTPNAPDLQAASDDGSSATDNQTLKTTLTFDVTGIDPGATAKLIRVDGESAGDVASRVGNGAITDTNVSVGVHTYFVAAMDAAGNEVFDNTRSIVVTVQAQPVFIPPTTTSTTAPSVTSTTMPSNPSTTPAKASNPTPQPGDTVRLDSTPPSGTGPTFDTKKPAAAVLVPADGGDDVRMPQPTFTTNADGSVSVSVQVPEDTPPGVYLVAVVGTAPDGTSRVIIVPVVVRRRTTTASVAAAAASARPVAVPAEVRAVQASVAAAGGTAAVGDAVLHHGATLSVADGRLIVDHHTAPGTNRAGLAGMAGLVLAALVLFRRSTRRLRSIR